VTKQLKECVFTQTLQISSPIELFIDYVCLPTVGFGAYAVPPGILVVVVIQNSLEIQQSLNEQPDTCH